MHEGPQPVGRTIYNGQTMTFTLASEETIEIEVHGGRCRWQIKAPPGVVIGKPFFAEQRNLDDEEDRR